jgi:hypothetical protein
MLASDARYKEFKEIYARAPKTMNAGTCSFDFKEGTNRIMGQYDYMRRFGQIYMIDDVTGRGREWNVSKGTSNTFRDF